VANGHPISGFDSIVKLDWFRSIRWSNHGAILSDGLAFDSAAGWYGWVAAWFAFRNGCRLVRSIGWSGTVCMDTQCVNMRRCELARVVTVCAHAQMAELAGTVAISNRFVRFMNSSAEGTIGWQTWQYPGAAAMHAGIGDVQCNERRPSGRFPLPRTWSGSGLYVSCARKAKVYDSIRVSRGAIGWTVF